MIQLDLFGGPAIDEGPLRPAVEPEHFLLSSIVTSLNLVALG